MADIDVQRKKSPVWPWVLGLVALALLAWALVAALGADEEVAVEQTPAPVPTAVPDSLVPAVEPGPDGPVVAAGVIPALEEYRSECTSVSQAREEMSPAHSYEASCIRLLSHALSSIIQRDTVGRVALDPALAEYRRKAEALEETVDSPRHANRVRDVAISSADLMRRVQETRTAPAPGLGQEVERVRSAATAIRGDLPLLEQKRETGEFFQRAGEALRLLAEREV